MICYWIFVYFVGYSGTNCHLELTKTHRCIAAAVYVLCKIIEKVLYYSIPSHFLASSLADSQNWLYSSHSDSCSWKEFT